MTGRREEGSGEGRGKGMEEGREKGRGTHFPTPFLVVGRDRGLLWITKFVECVDADSKAGFWHIALFTVIGKVSDD